MNEEIIKFRKETIRKDLNILCILWLIQFNNTLLELQFIKVLAWAGPGLQSVRQHNIKDHQLSIAYIFTWTRDYIIMLEYMQNCHKLTMSGGDDGISESSKMDHHRVEIDILVTWIGIQTSFDNWLFLHNISASFQSLSV